jgi:hypothetical protein
LFYWIYDYPSLYIGPLFAFVFAAAIWAAILFFRRFFRSWIHSEKRVNDMVGFAFSSFFVLYGLLLGLLAVASYQNFSITDDMVTKEASSLAALYSDLRGYREPMRGRLQDQLRDYTRYVIDQSWPQQQRGIVTAEGTHRITQFMDEVLAFKPLEKSEEIIHAEALRQLNTFVAFRRTRLANVTIGIPATLWWVVALGAFISIVLIAMLDMEIHVHLILGSALSVFLGSVIFVIAAMDNPFRGQVSVTPAAFETVYETLMKPNDAVTRSMAILMTNTAKLGPPRLEGKAAVAGKDVPGLYFGPTRMNNFFDEVDRVVEQNGGTATLFVKSGDEFVRVATNVKNEDGSRATGTVLDPKGPAFAAISRGVAFYGAAMILGKPYITAYEPIRDASANIIGIYYAGYITQGQ